MFSLKIKEGDKVTAGTALEKCLNTGEKVTVTVNKESFGVALKAIGTPIFDGKLTGAVAIAAGLAMQQALYEEILPRKVGELHKHPLSGTVGMLSRYIDI